MSAVEMWESRCLRFPRAVGRVGNRSLVFHSFHGPAFPRAARAVRAFATHRFCYTAKKPSSLPPSASSAGGPWGGNPSSFPPLQTGQNYVQLSSPSSCQVNNAYQTWPNTAQQMNVGALNSMQFNDPITPPSGVTQIGLQFAVYIMLTPQNGNGVWCFDDPEMEVDCP